MRRRRLYVVEGRGSPIVLFGVFVPLVVDHLVLMAECAAQGSAAFAANGGILGHEVFDAAVAARLDFPGELQLEVRVGAGRDEVALAPGIGTVRWRQTDAAVPHDPA